MKQHDIIVIGASAGGIPALREILGALDPALPATIFIAFHMRAGETQLAEVLGRAGGLPVRIASDDTPFEPGHVYLARPDRHLLLGDGRMHVRHGPRENGFRPAIDVLFRSAACHYGTQVIGVVLTGMLNDGSAGLRAIKRCGGIAVVQDPDEADYPDMPQSALRYVHVDHCVKLAEMPDLLKRLCAAPAGRPPRVPEEIRIECTVAERGDNTIALEHRLGRPSTFACPDCGGVLWEVEDGPLLRYRCHIGHAFTADALSAEQATTLEAALSSALRAHRERAELFHRLERTATDVNGEITARHYRERAAECERQAQVIVDFLDRTDLFEP